MTLKALAAADDHRAKCALPILLHPEKYKVCDACHSVSFKHTSICPVCHSYRWRDRVKAVQAVMKIILRRKDPFPVTLGVPPRIMQST